MMRFSKSFTLIELTVVVLIIALLATIVGVSAMGHQKSARDAQRKSDLDTLLLAFEMYYEKNRTYKIDQAGQKDRTTGQVTGTGELNKDYDGSSGSLLSIGDYLLQNSYISGPIRDPLSGNPDYYINFSTAGSESGICIYTKLEAPKQGDNDKYGALVAAGCNPPTGYGYNYVVGHK